MSEFSVTFQGVRSALDKSSAAADRLSGTANSVRSVRSKLTFEIRQRSQIDARLNAVARELEEHNASLRRLVTAGNTVCGLYQRTENSLLGLSVGDITWTQPTFNPDYIPGDGEDSQSILDNILQNLLNFLPTVLPGFVLPFSWDILTDLDFLKIIGKFFDKADVEGGGLLGDFAGYVKSFLEFFTGDMSGLSGFADWANLADDSIGLWKSGYETLKELGATGAMFTKEMAENIKAVGVIGSVIGTVGSFMDMMDTAGKSFQERLDDVANFGSSGTKTGLSALAMLGKIGKAGVYAGSAIAEAAFGFGAQVFDSIDKYNDDGWDLGDTGEVLVDASCEGLYSLGNALTFGGLGFVLDKITGNTDGDYGQMLSDTLKDGADKFSVWIVDTAQDVGGAISGAVDTVKDFASNMWNGFTNAWNFEFAT